MTRIAIGARASERAGVILSWVVVIAACSKSGDDKTRSKPLQYPVDVAKLELRQLQYTVTAPGSIEAYQVVQITARVQGVLDKVSFVEGQLVKEGDVLASIESERSSIAVSQAQSALAKAIATQKAAQAALDRRLTAQKESPGLVPGEEIEQKQTLLDTAKADVDSARQALRVAQLNLRDSQVRAPIGGVVQTRTVQQGQYLNPGAVLATLLQRDPLLLRFQVSEQDAPRLAAELDRSQKANTPFTAKMALKESPHEYTASIKLVAGSADPTTRLVPVAAQVDNTDHPYWLRPGAFCQVSVPIGNARKGIVVPSLAVAPTEKGQVVYVVDDKGLVHQTVIQTGMHTSDGGVELTQGVKEGETIVVRGIEPLSDGAPIKVNQTLTLDEADKQVKADAAGSAAKPASDGSAGSDHPPEKPDHGSAADRKAP
jgi:RND family efflux transporter MFP subunit